MKITYITTTRLPSEKANGIQITRMCEAFARTGADAELWYPARRQTDPALRDRSVFEFYGVAQRFRARALPYPDVFRVERLVPKLVFAAFVFAARTFWCLSMALALRFVRRGTLTYTRDELCCIWSLLLGLPTVLEAHYIPGSRTKKLLSWTFSLRRPRAVVALTAFIGDAFEEMGVPRRDILVAPDAVDLDAYSDLPDRMECRRELGLPEDARLVGYVGRFETMGIDKGVPDLIRAAADASRAIDERLVVVCVGGPLDRESEHHRIAESEGLDDENLILVDRRPHVEVPNWIRACDVVTIPWRFTEFSAYYTSPLKLFEYMAAGSVIVASDLPSLRDVLADGKNCRLFEPGSRGALADAIAEVMRDSDLAAGFGRQAARDAQRYTWEARARRILEAPGLVG